MKLVSLLLISLQLLILATAFAGARRCFKPTTPTTTPTTTTLTPPTTTTNDGDETSASSPPETTDENSISTDGGETSTDGDTSDVTKTTTTLKPGDETSLGTTTDENDLPTITTSPYPEVDADAMCKSRPGVQYLPHPYDCHKFIQCADTRGFIKTCQDNLFWNSEIQNCDRTCV